MPSIGQENLETVSQAQGRGARELQRRLEEHRAGAAVGPRSARLAHTDVWVGGWLVEPGD
jgi:hypothetical protein